MENKETGKPEEKILRQEEFKVDCPRKIYGWRSILL